MDEHYIPKTEIELERWMKANCYHFDTYAINGNEIYEGYGIERSAGYFIWYFTERGQQKNQQSFQSESDIVAFAFRQIKSDISAKSHLIGFTTCIDDSQQLASILEEMNISYFQDQIPYYGLERPVYRTFVIGCDIDKTRHLKDKYYIEQ